MFISDLAVKRPVGMVTVILICILFGIVGLADLSVDMMPEFSMTNVTVITTYTGAGPSEVEELVTEPLEDAFSEISGLDTISSNSREGVSQISLAFDDGVNIDDAKIEVKEAVDGAVSSLAGDAGEPIVKTFDLSSAPIYKLSVTSAYTDDIVELGALVDEKIATPLQRIEGVATVDISGTQNQEVQIELDSYKMQYYGLTAKDVSNILWAQNMNFPLGDIQEGSKSMNLKVEGNFESLDQLENLLIPTDSDGVRLMDIAGVTAQTETAESYSFTQGHRNVGVAVSKNSDANTIEVAEAIETALTSILEENPELEVIIIKDDSETIMASLKGVISAGLIGGVLAIFILLIFLRSFRSTLIVGVAIPISIVITFACMYAAGVGLNMISLMGLAIGIGMLVDNAIVVLENIYRFRDEGYPIIEAVSKGVGEVGFAIIASTLTSVAVFLPIVFAEGFAAAIFRDMALTVTFSLVASLFTAMTLVPMMSSKLLGKAEGKKHPHLEKILDRWEAFINRIEHVYKKMLQWALHHRKSTAAVSTAIFLASMMLLPMIGMELIPSMDEGRFEITATLPKGTVTEESLVMAEEIEAILFGVEGIGNYTTTIKDNEVSVDCILTDEARKHMSTSEMVQKVKADLRDIPGAEIEVGIVSYGSMGSSEEGVFTFNLLGNDFDTMNRIAENLEAELQKQEEVLDVFNDLTDGGEEGVLVVDRNMAAYYGLTVSGIASELRSVINGSTATTMILDNQEMDVNIVYDKDTLEGLLSLEDITIETPLGIPVTVDRVASIERQLAPSVVKRADGQRSVTVTVETNGLDSSSGNALIRDVLDDYSMPEGYSYTLGSDFTSMMESFVSLGVALMIGVVLIYFIMCIQFESFFFPLVIMFSVPYAMTGGLLMLYLTGTTLSIVGLIGFIMLVGMVVNNAIVLVDYTNQLRSKGMNRDEALTTAAPIRLKPILMTTMTTVLGMIPLAIGTGQGSEMQMPLARVVVGGLVLSTLVTLIVVPVNYSLIDSLVHRKKEDEVMSELEPVHET